MAKTENNPRFVQPGSRGETIGSRTRKNREKETFALSVRRGVRGKIKKFSGSEDTGLSKKEKKKENA